MVSIHRNNVSLILDNIPEFYKKTGVKNREQLFKSLETTGKKYQDATATDPRNPGANSTFTGVKDFLFDINATARNLETTNEDEKNELSAAKKVARELSFLNSAYNITKAAFDNGYIPEELKKDDALLTDLVNFIYNGSLGESDSKHGKARNALIKELGGELFANSREVLSGKYERPKKPTVIYIQVNIDRPGLLKPIELYELTETKLQELTKTYTNERDKSPKPPSTLKSNN